jgi:hypothetical protein
VRSRERCAAAAGHEARALPAQCGARAVRLRVSRRRSA